MAPEPDSPDNLLKAFDNWLLSNRLNSATDMQNRVRERLKDPGLITDFLLDSLPALPDPIREIDLSSQIRRRIHARPEALPEPLWFRWIMPLAAAATLALAISSFSSSAPGPADKAPDVASLAGQDPELTRIFALAANLDPDIDLGRLDSDAIALLAR